MRPAGRIASGVAATVLAALLTSCASSAGPASSSSTAAAGGSSASSAGSGSTSAVRITVNEAEDGTTLTVNRGADVIVALHSTYWQFQPASAPRVLVQAAPVVQGDPPSRAGIPGSGKGTARETYHAQAAGTATITATRTTCGEAMRCTAAQSVYRVTVIVR